MILGFPESSLGSAPGWGQGPGILDGIVTDVDRADPENTVFPGCPCKNRFHRLGRHALDAGEERPLIRVGTPCVVDKDACHALAGCALQR